MINTLLTKQNTHPSVRQSQAQYSNAHLQFSSRPKKLSENIKHESFNNRVTQAHNELQQFFAKFDDSATKKEISREKVYAHVKKKDPFKEEMLGSSSSSEPAESKREQFAEIDDIFDHKKKMP